MAGVDRRIDEYIDGAADFARPILEHLRRLIHEAYPDIQETIKWGVPYFEQKGAVCGIAAFKAHCAFVFWKEKLLMSGAFARSGEAMGSLGRITSLKDLPKDKELIALIREAVELNEKGIKAPKKAAAAKKELEIPEGLKKALAKNKRAAEAFEKFSYSHRKEYIEWINEAKTEPTRDKRIATTIEWVSEGKGRNWKYEKC